MKSSYKRLPCSHLGQVENSSKLLRSRKKFFNHEMTNINYCLGKSDDDNSNDDNNNNNDDDDDDNNKGDDMK